MKSSVIEAIALLCFITLGIWGYWQAGHISGLSFDPLGSRAIPSAISTIVVILSIVSAYRLVTGRTERDSNPEATSQDEPDFFPARDLLDVLTTLGLTILYVLALFSLRLPFSIVTLIFILCVATLISRNISARGTAIATAVGTIVGFGGEYIFTKVFFVDLPTLW